jgi:hypothetical protein
MALKAAPAVCAAPKSKLRAGYQAIAARVAVVQVSTDKAA